MPLYEYMCKSCEERVEAIQRFSDSPYTICPTCGGELKKLISSPAIQFKGSGFYLTDYGKGNSASTTKVSKSAGESSSSSDSSSSTKKE
ncbi:MAG: FmdB family zinc ribbon protein [Thermoanaerobaculia bacterium]